jgi:hypothetical protein
MNEIQLRDRLFELFPPEMDADWDDVLRRAKSPSWSFRRLTLLVAAALLAVLVVGSALALSGHLGGLFRGTPINDLTPRERFLLSELDMSGKVELIAKRNSRAFYVIRRSGGRLCYSIGDIRRNLTPAQAEARMRFGGGSCIDPRVFPSKTMPVLNFSYYSYQQGDAESRLAGLEGFAADPVDRIGVIGRDKRIVFSVPVDHNVYTAGKRRVSGARGIVALDEHGKVLWVQCSAIGSAPDPHFPSGGCGKYKNSPPPNLPPVTKPTKPARPAKPTRPVVVQRGVGGGVSIVVRGTQIEAWFAGLSAQKRRLLVFKDGRINLGCFKLVKVGGREYSRAVNVSTPFSPIVRTGLSPLGGSFAAPFDGCRVAGTYGRTWNDAHGTHDTVEISLTPKGRRFFAEQAVARDITWLARARVFRDIRYAHEAVAADEVARRLGSHVVPLDKPEATPPIGKLGVWVGEPRRIVLVERATTGRRLYLEIRHGVIYRTNLIGLAQVL